jgi:hypothetical protein
MLAVTVSICLRTMNHKFVHITYVRKACIEGGICICITLNFLAVLLKKRYTLLSAT